MTWGTNAGAVTVVLPSGASFTRPSVTVANVEGWAAEAGLAKYDVKDETGNLLGTEVFPVTFGTVRIEEYNEVKALCSK